VTYIEYPARASNGQPPAVVYTLGYKRKPLATFIGQLRQVGVDAVIDVRLRNTSHLVGYTKRDDLDFLLREGFSIAYEHHPELAPTPEILDSYLDDPDWAVYESRFLPLLAERAAEEVGRGILDRYRAPCLLCAEPTAEHCHRRLVAEYWARHLPELTIVHL
jgi:uncharacterized protein (DUF488 family)